MKYLYIGVSRAESYPDQWHRLLRKPQETGLAELIAQESRAGAFRGSNTFQTYLMENYTLQFW